MGSANKYVLKNNWRNEIISRNNIALISCIKYILDYIYVNDLCILQTTLNEAKSSLKKSILHK